MTNNLTGFALGTPNIKRQVKLPNVKLDKHHRKKTHSKREMHHDKRELLRLNII